MTTSLSKRARIALAAAILLPVGLSAAPIHAAPVITTVGADLAASPFTFSFMGSSFTFTGTGSFPDYLAVSTTGSAAVRTVFGRPSTDFTNRGTVVYDQNILGGYGSFASLTTIPTTNGENFLGLRVMSGGQTYYGFAFTTNATLNSYGFETAPNTAITATTALATAAVPETATWAMMIFGLAAVGGSLRRRNAKGAFSMA